MKLPPAARGIVAIIRRYRLNYDTFRQAAHLARQECLLKPISRGRRLPHLLTESSLKAFYEAVDNVENLQHQIMLRLLLFTAVRVSELINIRISDIDLSASKIFIESGKGDKDRYLLFPSSFRLTLQAYIASHSDHTYLFESNRHTKYTRRRIHQIVQDYAQASGINEHVHPHLFRHQCLTWLTKQGVSDQKIQLISGHSSRKSLEIYQHMALGDVSEDYQEAMKKIGV